MSRGGARRSSARPHQSQAERRHAAGFDRPLAVDVETGVAIDQLRAQRDRLVRRDRPREAHVHHFADRERRLLHLFAGTAHGIEQQHAGHDRRAGEVPGQDRVRGQHAQPGAQFAVDTGHVVQLQFGFAHHGGIVPGRPVPRTLAADNRWRSDAGVPGTVDPLILRVVPHRAPILRLERVRSATVELAVVAGREPTGPGALPFELGAIEGLAQAAAVLLAQAFLDHELPEAPRGMLVAVKRFAIEAFPPVGAELHYHVRLLRRFGPTTLLSGHVEHAGRRLCGGDLTLWSDQAR